MQYHTPAAAAQRLDIKPATLRKYSLALEKAQYKIKRNDKGHRVYSDNDIETVRRVITGIKNGVTFNESINNVLSIQAHSALPPKVDNDTVTQYEELKQLILEQHESMQLQIDLLQEQNKLLIERIEQQEKERQQLLLEQQEQEENKGGFFSRLFKK